MKLRAKTRENSWLAYVLLAGVAALSHAPYIGVGLDLLNSDWATEPLMAEELRTGRWGAFHFRHPYGGIALTALRALWQSVFSTYSFTYLVIPVALTLATYRLLVAYVSRTSAFAVALAMAVGLQSWVNQLGVSAYIAYFLGGSLLLAYRARYRDPFNELSRFTLLICAIASGILFYTTRISQIFLLAFWFPWHRLPDEIRLLKKLRSPWERRALGTALFFIGLWAYLELFGPAIGNWNGKSIRLHAHPNLTCGILIVGCLLARAHRKAIKREHLERAAILTSGFLIGAAPEIAFWWNRGEWPGDHSSARNVAGTVSILGRVPESLSEILVAGNGLGKIASNLLGVAALMGLISGVRRDRRLVPVVASAVLAVYAYARIITYSDAPSRYLLPILPAVLVGLACFLEASPARSFRRLFVLALLAVHLSDHERAHLSQIASLRTADEAARIHEVVETFRQKGVPLILSDDYWSTNQLTWASLEDRGSPLLFTAESAASPGPGFRAFGPGERLPDRLGVLLNHDRSETNQIELGNRRWSLQKIARIGSHTLYHAEAKP